MRDPHRLIIGEVDSQPVGDLLRAPRCRPPAVLTARLVRDRSTARSPAPAPPSRPGAEPARPAAPARTPASARQPRASRSSDAGPPLRLPLRDRRPVLELPAAGSRVAAQLPGDRRRRSPNLTSDLAHTRHPARKQRDLLPLSKRQVAPRQRGERDSRHPATVPEPPDTNRLRHARQLRGLHASSSLPDRQPEHRRSTGTQPAAAPATASPPVPSNPDAHPFGLPIATLHGQALRRPVESAQYTSRGLHAAARRREVLASVGSVGDAYDNAMAESFVDSFKTELIARSRLALQLPARARDRPMYVGWYNQPRATCQPRRHPAGRVRSPSRSPNATGSGRVKRAARTISSRPASTRPGTLNHPLSNQERKPTNAVSVEPGMLQRPSTSNARPVGATPR